MKAMDATFGEMLDMSSEARAEYFRLIAGMSLHQRARKVAGLGRAARALARAGIRQQRPGASACEIEIALIARLYGEPVARYLAPYLASIRG